MLICILTKNVITSCSVTMMLFLHLEVKPLMTLTDRKSGSAGMRDRKSGSAGMPRPISYAVFCLKKKKKTLQLPTVSKTKKYIKHNHETTSYSEANHINCHHAVSQPANLVFCSRLQ